MLLLMKTSFPDSELMAATNDPPRRIGGMADWVTVGQMVNEPRVRVVIHSFEPYKAPGFDNITPALLQQCLEELDWITDLAYQGLRCSGIGAQLVAQNVCHFHFQTRKEELVSVVGFIEAQFERKEVCVGSFLLVEVMFSRTGSLSIRRCAKELGISGSVTKWIMSSI